MKNWEGVLEQIKYRLKTWEGLSKSLSYKGRTLVINNLIATKVVAQNHRSAAIKPTNYGYSANAGKFILEWIPLATT